MSGIQSSIGLVSGVDIAGTVEQLLAIAARPRDALVARSEKVAQEQKAITDLTTLVVSLELAAKKLSGPDSVFQRVKVASSNSDLLSATSTGSPAIGSYTVTPIRKAQTNQLLSSRFDDPSSLLGAGSISFQNGGHVRQDVSLDTLNGGQGVDRGRIRITDRSGASQVIDLSYAKSTQDVIDTINNATDINVQAELDGDRIKLVDNTGQAVANLRVQDVGTDTTATDLGLASINIAADQALGDDILSLSRLTSLTDLNNGNGIGISSAVNDLVISLSDGGGNVEVDLSGSKNLGDLLDKINQADPGRVQAQISADGDRIEILDLTSGGGTFTVSSGAGSSAAEDLGIAGTGTGTITGTRLNAGLDTVLLSRLDGGKGLGELGELTVQDRSGNSATINLAGVETLDDVLSAINNTTGISIQARINDTGTGFQLIDTSGGTGDLIIGSGVDGLETAQKLKISGTYQSDTINSQPLNLQSVNRSTKLADYRGGITNGSFLITDSSGATGAVNLRVLEAETIGDVLDAINSLSIGVQAEINDEGNGIKLTDTAGGANTLTVSDSGTGTAATDLGIAGTATLGEGTQTLNGTQRTTIEITEDDTLDSLIQKINESDSGVRASRFFDGVGYRLNLVSETPGAQGNIWLDSTLDTSFETIAKGQDALLQYGPAGSSASLLLSSNSNTFGELIPDVEFTINQASTESVTVDVERNQAAITEAVKLFVEQFNKVTEKVNEYTKFESESTASGVKIKTGLLFGTSEALRVEQDLTRLATGAFKKVGNLASLRDIGVEYDFETEKLTFDEDKFKEVLNADPEAVADFFYQSTTTELGGDETETTESGVAVRFLEVTDRLAGIENSLLLNRNNALQRQIETFAERIELKNVRLQAQQTRLLKMFYKMEENLSRLQESQTALNAMQIVPPIGSSSDN